jgi:hypothetical protein
MRYGGSNPPLCTIIFVVGKCFGVVVDLSPAGSGRMAIALTVFAILGLMAWQTMEPGKFRSLTWILLGFFAFRVVLTHLRSR